MHEFHNDKNKADGKRSICKECAISCAMRRYQCKKDEIKTQMLDSYYKNKEVRLQKAKEWRDSNSHSVKAKNSRQRAKRSRAIVGWYGEFDEFVVSEAYLLAKQRKSSTGFAWHVDHVVPIAGNLVCGFHTWSNIAVIPASINLSKSNRFVCA